eukprot:g2613.t1
MTHALASTKILAIFFVLLALALIRSPGIFCGRHGRRHRVVGLAHLMLLTFGTIQLAINERIGFSQALAFDIAMGIGGIATTLTAAHDFRYPHRLKVGSSSSGKNRGSGTLDREATVTYSEMVEHSFYQGLNLAQILFFHTVSNFSQTWCRVSGLALVTSPWLCRGWFPVNRFSDNYRDEGGDIVAVLSTTRVMYAVKKAQYLAYKHFLFHGMNIYVAMLATRERLERGVALDHRFRQYWMLLNVSYVMEFFLQTLVRRGVVSQGFMLTLQMILMAGASMSIFTIDFGMPWVAVAIVSLIMNFANRGHDIINTFGIAMATAAAATIYTS